MSYYPDITISTNIEDRDKLGDLLGSREFNNVECRLAINTIINLCKIENVLEFDGDIKLSTIDTIYLGDDFVIFITYSRQLIKYVLPYDYRAMNEVNLIISSLKN